MIHYSSLSRLHTLCLKQSVHSVSKSIQYTRQRFFHQSTILGDSSSHDPSFVAYLSSLGYTDRRIQGGIHKALTLSFGTVVNDSHLTMLGKEGVHALAKSVERDIEAISIPQGVVHFVVPHHNLSFDLSMKFGQTFMQLVKDDEQGQLLLGEYLECSCGGNMSCSTCHIILDPDSYAKCDLPSEAECDMLDLAYEPKETSRLGCQIRMKKELDGMTVTIPAEAYDLWK